MLRDVIAGNGGDGGSANAENNTYKGLLVIFDDEGGIGLGNELIGGSAGSGGSAVGITNSNYSQVSIENVFMSNIYGGNGGQGGDANQENNINLNKWATITIDQSVAGDGGNGGSNSFAQISCENVAVNNVKQNNINTSLAGAAGSLGENGTNTRSNYDAHDL